LTFAQHDTTFELTLQLFNLLCEKEVIETSVLGFEALYKFVCYLFDAEKPINPVKPVKPIRIIDWLTGLIALTGYFATSA